MKILVHGFGTFALVFRHLVETAQRNAPEIEWSMILPTEHHYDVIRQVLPADRILSLERHQSRRPKATANLDFLKDYVGNIYADIEAEKRAFKHRRATYQVVRAAEIYQIYKAFMQQVAPTHLLISQLEGYEGKVLVALAKELGIRVIVPVTGRNIGGTFFSSDAHETLPAYRKATPETMQQAADFIGRFRKAHISAGLAAAPADPGEQLSSFRPPLTSRIARFIRRSVERPDLFDIENLRTSLLNNMPLYRDAMFRMQKRLNERHYDIDSLDTLPGKFIYYPLQYSPESSINTPAPYYVDQFRVVDALRFSMPSDHLLVVKEHPTCLTVRALDFMPKLRRRAGVVVVQHEVSSRELIKRAALTASVTGTATLEAFLLGRPSLVLGSSLVSSYLGGACSIGDLPRRIREKIGSETPDEEVQRAVADILSIRYDFLFSVPGLPGEPVLRQPNIDRFLAALLDHIRRDAELGLAA